MFFCKLTVQTHDQGESTTNLFVIPVLWDWGQYMIYKRRLVNDFCLRVYSNGCSCPGWSRSTRAESPGTPPSPSSCLLTCRILRIHLRYFFSFFGIFSSIYYIQFHAFLFACYYIITGLAYQIEDIQMQTIVTAAFLLKKWSDNIHIC